VLEEEVVLRLHLRKRRRNPPRLSRMNRKVEMPRNPTSNLTPRIRIRRWLPPKEVDREVVVDLVREVAVALVPEVEVVQDREVDLAPEVALALVREVAVVRDPVVVLEPEREPLDREVDLEVVLVRDRDLEVEVEVVLVREVVVEVAREQARRAQAPELRVLALDRAPVREVVVVREVEVGADLDRDLALVPEVEVARALVREVEVVRDLAAAPAPVPEVEVARAPAPGPDREVVKLLRFY
jgi:hypothetical protein